MSASGTGVQCASLGCLSANKCYPHIPYPYNYDSFGRYSGLRESPNTQLASHSRDQTVFVGTRYKQVRIQNTGIDLISPRYVAMASEPVTIGAHEVLAS